MTVSSTVRRTSSTHLGLEDCPTDCASPEIALQIGDKYRVTTPVNWNKGDDVIVHPSVSNEEAKTLFPEFTIHKVRVCVRHSNARSVTEGSLHAAIPENYAAQG